MYNVVLFLLCCFATCAHAIEDTSPRMLFVCSETGETLETQITYQQNGKQYTFTSSGNRFIAHTDKEKIYTETFISGSGMTPQFYHLTTLATESTYWHTALGHKRAYQGGTTAGIQVTETVDYMERTAHSRLYYAERSINGLPAFGIFSTIDDDDIKISSYLILAQPNITIEISMICRFDPRVEGIAFGNKILDDTLKFIANVTVVQLEP